MQRIVICGAGRVGLGVTDQLVKEGNTVSVIDHDPILMEKVMERFDVKGVIGNASSPDALLDADIEQADMIIAVTQSDEINMMSCQISHSLFSVPTKIARIMSQNYLQPKWRSLFTRDNIPIDVIISPQAEVGEKIISRLVLAGSVDTVFFSDDMVLAIEINIKKDCPIIETPLKQLSELFDDLNAIIIGIMRSGDVVMPKGKECLYSGDSIYLVVERSQIERLMAIFNSSVFAPKRAIITGGGNMGYYVANRIESAYNDMRIAIIEADRKRASWLATELDQAIVFNGSGTDVEILQDSGIDKSDVLLALTEVDETNVVSCLLAKEMGVNLTIALVNNSTLPRWLKNTNIDAFIDPKAVTVSTVIKHLRRGRILNVYSIWNGAAEIIEAEALESSALVGKALSDLPDIEGIRIGSIYRDKKYIKPSGKTNIKANDRVVMLARRDVVTKVEQLFRVSIDFF